MNQMIRVVWLCALELSFLISCKLEREFERTSEPTKHAGDMSNNGGSSVLLDVSNGAVVIRAISDSLHVSSAAGVFDQAMNVQYRAAMITSERVVDQMVFTLPLIESAFFRGVDTIDAADVSRIVPNATLVVLGKGCRLVSKDGAHWPSSMRTLDVSECEIDDRERMVKSLSACRLDTLVLSYNWPSDISSLHKLESVVALSIDLKAPLTDIREFYRMKRLRLLIVTNVSFMDTSMIQELSRQRKFEFSYLYPFK